MGAGDRGRETEEQQETRQARNGAHSVSVHALLVQLDMELPYPVLTPSVSAFSELGAWIGR